MSNNPHAIMSAEQATKIALAWAAGAKYYDACLAAGVTRGAAKRMRDDPDWMAAYDRAKAEFVARSLQRIDGHGEKDWKAQAWLLERIMPEKFGKRETQDVNVKVTALPWQSALTGEVIDVKAEVKDAPKEEDGNPSADQAS